MAVERRERIVLLLFVPWAAAVIACVLRVIPVEAVSALSMLMLGTFSIVTGRTADNKFELQALLGAALIAMAFFQFSQMVVAWLMP